MGEVQRDNVVYTSAQSALMSLLPPPGEDYAPSVQIADELDNGMWYCSVVVMSTFRRASMEMKEGATIERY